MRETEYTIDPDPQLAYSSYIDYDGMTVEEIEASLEDLKGSVRRANDVAIEYADVYRKKVAKAKRLMRLQEVGYTVLRERQTQISSETIVGGP